MEKLNWIIPLISIIVAIVSASLSYYFTKKLQMKSDERRLKEEYYQNYINAISEVAMNNKDFKALDNLADNHNKITLVGSPEVVLNAMNFHSYIIESRKNNSFSIQHHDLILTELIKSMRLDLYKTKKTNKNYPVIHLSGKGK